MDVAIDQAWENGEVRGINDVTARACWDSIPHRFV